MELRVEGESGVMDAGQSLRVLTMLADVVRAVAPEDADLPRKDLHLGSAAATIKSPDVASDQLLSEVRAAFAHPHRLTRRLRQDLHDAYEQRNVYAITGFGFSTGKSTLDYDGPIHTRVSQSLSRPTGWGAVTGEVRHVGRAGRGLSGKIRSEVEGHVVNFEAPATFEDELRETLFRRAALAGEVEVDEEGSVKRLIVERVRLLDTPKRLSDLQLPVDEFDEQTTLAALQELRAV